MKLNRKDVLGSFDGFASNIKSGKNIKNGMLIYTRFHEDAHKIFQASSEMGLIIFFLKTDSIIASKKGDFGYCNRITAFVDALEMFMENITEIFANTCELLAVNENGLDVKEYIGKFKKGEYKKYCFLFDDINCFSGSFYDKVNILLDASSKAMQKYGIDYVKIGLEEGIVELREKLASCEAPEILMQRILYGEVISEKKELELNKILNVLEELGTLKYINDFISLVRTPWFQKYVNEMLENKDLLNLKFHKNTAYFVWDDIKCKYVSLKDLISRKTDFVAIHTTESEECVVYKFFHDQGIIKCCIDVDELDIILDTVKYVMFERGKSNKVDKALYLRNNLILISFYSDIEDYFKMIILLKDKSRFITISSSKDYEFSFGGLISTDREIHLSVFNGIFSPIFYQLVEVLGGKTYNTNNMSDFFETVDLMNAYGYVILFCLEATS